MADQKARQRAIAKASRMVRSDTTGFLRRRTSPTTCPRCGGRVSPGPVQTCVTCCLTWRPFK